MQLTSLAIVEQRRAFSFESFEEIRLLSQSDRFQQRWFGYVMHFLISVYFFLHFASFSWLSIRIYTKSSSLRDHWPISVAFNETSYLLSSRPRKQLVFAGLVLITVSIIITKSVNVMLPIKIINWQFVLTNSHRHRWWLSPPLPMANVDWRGVHIECCIAVLPSIDRNTKDNSVLRLRTEF